MNGIAHRASELDFRHLRLVAAMAELGNMSRAADQLHLTQSALSHTLRDAEEKLGTALFHRVGRRMVLTPAGEKLLRSARAVLGEMQRTEEEIRRAARGDQGVLRIATQCYTNYHWLPARLKAFRKKYPRVEVQVMAEATPRPIEALLEGTLDLAIVGCQTVDPRIVLEPLFRPEFVLVTSPDHPLAKKAYVNPEDLRPETLILYSDREESTLYQEILRANGVEPARYVRVQLTEAILELVRAGEGVTMMAKWAVEPQLANRTLRAIRLTKRGYWRQWSTATVKGWVRPAYLEEFLRLLKTEPTLGRREWPAPSNGKTLRRHSKR